MSTLNAQSKAPATVANQPVFDGGGFAVQVDRLIEGCKQEAWESLKDVVEIFLDTSFTPPKSAPHPCWIQIKNVVQEERAPFLPQDPKQHTAGRVILETINALQLALRGYVEVTVTKGISVRGTGLGSSGASAAAALKAFEEIARRLNERPDTSALLSDNQKMQILQHADFGVPDNAIPAYFGGYVSLLPDSPGTSLQLEKIQPPLNFGPFVLVTPRGFGIKTTKAREVLQDRQPPQDHNELRQLMLDALVRGWAQDYGMYMEKAHEWFVTSRQALYPGDGALYRAVYGAAKTSGALGVTMAGAGPTLLAITNGGEIAKKAGQAMCQKFREYYVDCIGRIVSISMQGASISG